MEKNPQAQENNNFEVPVAKQFSLEVQERWWGFEVAELLQRIDELLVITGDEFITVVLAMFGRDEEAQSVDQVDCGGGVNADLEVDLEEIL